MGVYSTGLESFLDESINIENFWKKAQEHSIQLHNRLKNNEDLLSVLNGENFLDSLIQNKSFYDSDEKVDLFTLSNTGILKTRLNTDGMNDVIHIKENYTAMPAFENRYSALLFNGVSTINKCLFWSFSFNEKYFSKLFISNLKINMLDIINKLVCFEEEYIQF